MSDFVDETYIFSSNRLL